MQKIITFLILGVVAALPHVVVCNFQDKDKKNPPEGGKAVNGLVASAEVVEQ